MTRRMGSGLVAGLLLLSGMLSAQGEEPTYLLRYKLEAGEQLHYRVVHVASTKARINDTEETSDVRTVSIKAWDVTDVDDEGEMTFGYGVQSVEMTQRAGDAPEIRWDSNSDDIPPVQFSRVAERLGKVLGTVRINGQGQIMERSGDEVDSGNLGMGDVTLPLPEDAVALGGQWSVPREVRTKNEGGTLKIVKVRELYTLEKVQTGVATISVRSEPLTPVDDQSVKSQLVQQLSNGTIRFDIDAGRMLSRQLDWDASIVGFQGPSSNMEYRARLTEELEPTDAQTARLKAADLR